MSDNEDRPTETPNVPLDRGVVKDALREILEEIPAFRALTAGTTPTSGATGGLSVTAATTLPGERIR